MFNELNESIEDMNYEEMEAMSFKETLSLEEAVCEVIANDNMKGNTSLTPGKSPYHGDIDSLVNSLMFHNQDHIGLPEEDMMNYDPDANLSTGGRSAISSMSSEDDSVSLVESLLSEDNSDDDSMTEDEIGEDDDDNEESDEDDGDDKPLGEGLLADLLE